MSVFTRDIVHRAAPTCEILGSPTEGAQNLCRGYLAEVYFWRRLWRRWRVTKVARTQMNVSFGSALAVQRGPTVARHDAAVHEAEIGHNRPFASLVWMAETGPVCVKTHACFCRRETNG